MNHGAIKRLCYVCGWVAGEHWSAHEEHYRDVEVGARLVNPASSDAAPGQAPKEIDNVEVLAVTESKGEKVVTYRKHFVTPEDEQRAGHHALGATTLRLFMRRYGGWS